MKSTFLGRLLRRFYLLFNGHRRHRVGGIIISLILRAEGKMYSQTARELLKTYHGVDIGSYSYGPCFEPGRFPPDVTIGNYVSIGPDVRVFNANHPIETLSTHPFFYDRHEGMVEQDLVDRHPLTIGPDVWLGAGAIITPGCRSIGVGAVIGAGAVVTKDVPDFAIVGGVPAKVIRYRFDEDSCDAIRQSRWWQRSIDDVKQCMPEMVKPLAAVGRHPLIDPPEK